ncbi:MAG: ABC transporter substrate-binding protein [Bacteroidetes bacterium]|nr:ABC transporter substrate-binding protein [Bacteroidota bacterium]
MLGNLIQLRKPAQRIVSLVPSQTELLFDLGLNKEVVGITKFCIHPASWFQEKKIVGGTKNIHLDVIRELKPDLIIANKEENVEEAILELQKEFPVWISDVNTIPEACYMISEIGKLCDRTSLAQNFISKINQNFESLSKASALLGKRAVYYIWKNPWLTAGHHTFIHSMLEACGLQNESKDMRYPEFPPDQLNKLAVDYIFLSSEPYPFREEDKEYLSQFIDKNKIIFVDGTYFSWYGTRLINAPSYFKQLTFS